MSSTDTMQRIARGGSLATAGTALAAALGLVLVLVVSHGLTPESAGVFFSAIAVFLVLQTFLSFGVGAGVVRFIPWLRTLDRSADLRNLLIVALVPVAAASLIGAVGLWFAAPTVAQHLGGSERGQTVDALRLLAVMVVPGALELAVVESVRGFAAIRPYVLLQQVLVPLGRPILVLMAVAAGQTTMWVIVLAWSLPLVAALVVGAVLVVRSVRTEQATAAARRVGVSGEAAKPTPLPALAREYWAFTGVRGLANVAEILVTWLDVLLVAQYASLTASAIYAAASRFVTSGTLVLSALRLTVAPELSAALARNELSVVSRIYRTLSGWVVLTSWPLYFFMAVFAPVILNVFGSAYRAGATAFAILCLAMLLALAAGNVSSVLLMSGRSAWVLMNKTLALVVNIGGNMLLIPALGMNGAAIAWGASIAVDSGLSFAQVRWRMGIGGSLGPLLACAAAATVCFGVLPLLVRLAWAPSLAAAVVAALLASATYAPAVWRLRHAADLRLLIDALHRRRAPKTAGRHSVARPSLGLPPVKGSA